VAADWILALVAAAGAMVQVPVQDPQLPTGELMSLGSLREGDLYIDFASFKPSDLPGVVRGTALMVQPFAPPQPGVMVAARLWIICNSSEYQVDSGRLYDQNARQIATTTWVRNQALASGPAGLRLKALFCDRSFGDVAKQPKIPDFRAALAVSKSQGGPEALLKKP
jgi:hypothetical protein